MKAMTSLCLCLLVLCVLPAGATIWIVDNNHGVENADFTSLQEAENGASPGDTLYVIGSGNSYGSIQVEIPLCIFGPGYFLGENPETQANTANASCGQVYFYPGADGSLISGMYINNIVASVHGLIITRNRIKTTNNTHCILLQNNSSNVIITQNYIHQNYNNTNVRGIWLNGAANIRMENNYLEHVNGDGYIVYMESSAIGAEVHHNIFRGHVRAYYSTITSNIQYSGNFVNAAASNHVSFNIGSADQFGTENGNQSNVNMESIFLGTGSSDGRWQLTDGSPAVGAGRNGEDCGMFGGSTPYVLSGIPLLPTITNFVSPAHAGTIQGLTVEVEARARH